MEKKKRNRKKWKAKPTELSESLKAARKSHIGYRQIDIADATGVPRSKISRYESGAQIPSKENLEKLIRYYFRNNFISFQELTKIRGEHCAAVQEKRINGFKIMGYRS